MALDQIDKLKQLTGRLIESGREARFKIAELEQENKELKKRLERLENVTADSADTGLENLLLENEKLKQKNEHVKKSLGEMVNRLEPRLR